jgi:manganese/iron transport system permease protein
MRTALVATVLVTLACASVGVHVVLRRMAFVGHAVGHAVLPGVVVAILWGGSLLLGALVAGVITAVAIGLVSARRRVTEDTAIGVVLSGMFALGVLLMSRTGSFRDLSHVLFGNVLAVRPEDLWSLGAIAALVLLVLVAFHKELELTAVDPTHATAIGIPVDRVRMGLLLLIAPTIVAGVDVVGVILVAAMLVTPAATAGLLVRRVVPMMVVSVVVGVTSGVVGLLVSYHYGGSSGAAIVLVATGFFVVAWIASTITQQVVRTRRAEDAAPAEAAGDAVPAVGPARTRGGEPLP